MTPVRQDLRQYAPSGIPDNRRETLQNRARKARLKLAAGSREELNRILKELDLNG